MLVHALDESAKLTAEGPAHRFLADAPLLFLYDSAPQDLEPFLQSVHLLLPSLLLVLACLEPNLLLLDDAPFFCEFLPFLIELLLLFLEGLLDHQLILLALLQEML